MSGYRMLIGGQLVEGESTLEVLNPATEEVVAACPRASKAQLDQAVAAAKAAFPAWSATPIETRKQALTAIADVLKANVDVLGRLLTQEQGKPLRDATGEVLGTAAFFRYFAGLDLEPRVVEDSPKRHVTLRRRPLGVVAAIMPWNFPLIMLGFKIPAALLAGNTVVAKPAATTPLTALKFAELVKDLLPAGVLNIITDANDLGGELTRHPDVRKVSFTGSTETGRKVMAGAADMLKRITLELGGNDAAIVLADQDPKAVAPKIFGGAFANGGQICVAIKRVYAHESIYDELCDELAKLAEAHVVGDGLEQGVQMGPIQNRMQFEKVLGFIEDGRRDGKVIAGGERIGDKGFFVRPTIVRDIEDGARLVDEEQFGPILPVIKIRDADDALDRANRLDFGLGGSVWSADIERAVAIAERMDTGTIWINKHGEINPNVPFAGAKTSGIGIELGEEGLAEFTQVQVINVAR
jgi:acyl-CoA reductase-like NAD-dependent aldehyde dehydrogenase